MAVSIYYDVGQGSGYSWVVPITNRSHLPANVLGQIPKEKTKGRVTLLQPDDARHVFAESYRNVRSSIFFMPYDGPRP